jgi:hypothetical protein
MEITREGKQPIDLAKRRQQTAEETAADAADRAVTAAQRAADRLRPPTPTAPKVDATAEDTAKDEAAAEAYAADKADAEIRIHTAEIEAATIRKAADESRAALDALGDLESDAQRDARAVYLASVALIDAGADLPAAQYPTIDDLRAHIEAVCLARLKAEIANDPAGRGYAGKTDAETAALVSEGYTVNNADGDPVFQIARGAVIFMGIPYAPNAVTADDVTGAR